MEHREARYTVPFTPLSDRIAQEEPQLLLGLKQLQSSMGRADYDKYIETLLALRVAGDQLLLITRREMYRSILMSRFLPALQECFGVRMVRIVNQ